MPFGKVNLLPGGKRIQGPETQRYVIGRRWSVCVSVCLCVCVLSVFVFASIVSGPPPFEIF